MRRLTVIILTIFLSSCVEAREIKNGFYLRSKIKTDLPAKTWNGKSIYLGGKYNPDIRAKRLISLNNENTNYCLEYCVNNDDKADLEPVVLFASGMAYMQSEVRGYYLIYYFQGKERAKLLGKCLGIEPIYRRHPGHKLLISFHPSKEFFSIGEELNVTFRIKNVGKSVVFFSKGGRNRAMRDNQFYFSAFSFSDGKQVKDIGSSHHGGGIVEHVKLKPGEVFEQRVTLGDWFKFNKVDDYEVVGSNCLEFMDPDKDIEKYEKYWGSRTIWTDYASASFLIKIRETMRNSAK